MGQETKPGYEPDRIPASVFATTTNAKQEWSMQSNESLFSIQMGDHSFTNMYKSGELSNFDYIPSYINNNNDNKIILADTGTKEVNVPVVETGTKTGIDGLANFPKPDSPQSSTFSPTKSYRSDVSNNSTSSFAFPILTQYQEERKAPVRMNNKSGQREISRPDPRLVHQDMQPDEPKPRSGYRLFCCFCCSWKK